MAKEQEQPREFKVKGIETVNLYSNTTSVFPTPTALAERIAADVPSDAHMILEPSAGTGNLANAIRRELTARGQYHTVDVCEIVGPLAQSLTKQGFPFPAYDFLEYKPDFLYDCIVMNPPFANTAWIDHVEHALEVLKPEGTLLAIVPQGFTFRDDKRIRAFRELVKDYGYIDQLPDDSFMDSGTAVNTVYVSLIKPD